MAMIQPIDGNALINAFRAGKEDRYNDQAKALDLQAKQAKAGSLALEQGLQGQLFRGSGGGVAAQYAPGTPGPVQGALAQSSGSFDQAFSPPAMAGIEAGQSPPVAPPTVAPSPAMQAPPREAYDPDIMRKLIVINPEKYGAIATAFKGMDENSLKMHQAKNDIMGAAAHYVAQGGSQEEQVARFEHAIPQLMQSGWSQQELASAEQNLKNPDPNVRNRALQGYQAVAIDFDKMIDNELAQREFEAGKVVTPQAGAGAFIAHPNGVVDTLIAPNDGTHPAGTQVDGLRHVETAADYANIPPGANYTTPDGHVRQKPGGPTPQASGSF